MTTLLKGLHSLFSRLAPSLTPYETLSCVYVRSFLLVSFLSFLVHPHLPRTVLLLCFNNCSKYLSEPLDQSNTPPYSIVTISVLLRQSLMMTGAQATRLVASRHSTYTKNGTKAYASAMIRHGIKPVRGRYEWSTEHKKHVRHFADGTTGDMYGSLP